MKKNDLDKIRLPLWCTVNNSGAVSLSKKEVQYSATFHFMFVWVYLVLMLYIFIYLKNKTKVDKSLNISLHFR